MTLAGALRATAVDYAGSEDEKPQITEYLLRAADALDVAHPNQGTDQMPRLTDKTEPATFDGPADEPMTQDEADAKDATLGPNYPRDTESLVTVTFTDGEVKVYPISASPTIARYLGREMSDNGVLTLFCKKQSVGIPASQIRTFEIAKYEP
jgi:hypothetical protein